MRHRRRRRRGSAPVSATSHVDRFVEDASTAYLAPESIAGGGEVGEHLDIFSLGAIAYHLFSGEPPAANGLELSTKLHKTKGLQISSALNGAGESLQDLVKFATHPEVNNRLDSAADFLEWLDKVENELSAPDRDFVTDPALAQQGSTLPGDLKVLKRLGQGACSVALLGRTGRRGVDLEGRRRPRPESAYSRRSRGCQEAQAPAYRRVLRSDRDRRPRSVFHAPGSGRSGSRRDARPAAPQRRALHIEMLERFGFDLLDVVKYLQEQGIAHRDIKPDNIAVGSVGKGETLHVVLFDFSLARTPADNIRAGTKGYLDPLLPLAQPPRWDLHAERYAAAATLHELATGTLPRWGTAPPIPRTSPARSPSTPSSSTPACASPSPSFSARHFAATSKSGLITPKRCSVNGAIASRISSSPTPYQTRTMKKPCAHFGRCNDRHPASRAWPGHSRRQRA